MDYAPRVRWLKIGSALTIGFGILVAAAATPLLSAPAAFLVDMIFFPVDGLQGVSGDEIRLVNAIAGGIMVGWGVMLWMVSTKLYPQDPVLGRQLILTSVGIWFVIDSTGSIIAGAPLNALFNVSFLLLFFVPVWKSS